MGKNKKYVVELAETEFNYIYELLEEMYKNLSKLPKKFRTHKFYILENLVNNTLKNNLQLK